MSHLNERPVISRSRTQPNTPSVPPSRPIPGPMAGPSTPPGVQFPPVVVKGTTFLPGQANNFYIFPAVGMAIFATRASRVTDEMFIAAARAVADQVSPAQLRQGLRIRLQVNIRQ